MRLVLIISRLRFKDYKNEFWNRHRKKSLISNNDNQLHGTGDLLKKLVVPQLIAKFPAY